MPAPVCVGLAPEPDEDPEPGEGRDVGDCPPETEGLPPPALPPLVGVELEPALVTVPNNCSEENV